MKVPKPSEVDFERFRRTVPDAPGIEVKKMFGNEAAFVNGNMFMGLFGANIGIRLPEDRREALASEPGSGPFGPPDRPMKQYMVIPEHWDDDTAEAWVAEALAHVSAMPPKQPKRKG